MADLTVYLHVDEPPQVEVMVDPHGHPYGVLRFQLTDTHQVIVFLRDKRPSMNQPAQTMGDMAARIEGALQEFMDPMKNEHGRLEDGNADAA